jgi:hypothetical protein
MLRLDFRLHVKTIENLEPGGEEVSAYVLPSMCH